MIESGDIQVIIEDGNNANLTQQIAYIRAGKTEIEEAVQEGIGDFDTNATAKTNAFNDNASAKTLSFNQNADAKTTIYDNNASEKLSAYNENATNKLAAYNANDTAKTEAYNLNATNKTTAFNTNASEKTSTFNDNAIAKTNAFNSNATSKTNDFNSNASDKTTAFNDNYNAKKALIDAEVQTAKDWATKTDGKVDGVDYSAKYYAQSILPIASEITTVAGIASDVTTVAGIKDDVEAVADNTTDISAVADDLTNINTVAGDHNNIQTVVNNMTAINNAPTYANNSKIWAEGTDGEVTPLGGTHSSKVWAQIAKDAASGVQNPANRDLSNLTNTGQMVIDSQNGTISNCILEIPQNIKLTLENNVLTLKAGSVLVRSGSTYSTLTTQNDISATMTGSNLKYMMFTQGGYIRAYGFDRIVSGNTDTQAGIPWHCWFDTENKNINTYGSDATTPVVMCYPICVIKSDSNGIWSFSKDSNGNDMIFNGAGFVGHHAFVYPNVKRLRANGFNADGTLSSVLNTTASLEIIEMYSNRNCILLNGTAGYYQEIDDLSQAINFSWWLWYVKNLNFVGVYYNNTFSVRTYTPLVSFTLDNNNQVTNWTPRIPVRLATTEMLDKKQDTLTFDTTPTSGSSNPVTSGGVYTALGTKQATIDSSNKLSADLVDDTSTTNKFVTSSEKTAIANSANQDLSNLSDTGQMVVDSQNGTISNCILEIPQNIKCEISDGYLVLKAGSVLVNNGETYETITINSDTNIKGQPSLNGDGLIFYSTDTLTYGFLPIERINSGNTQPTSLSGNMQLWFNTSERKFYLSTNAGVDWVSRELFTYPICAVHKESGNVTEFLKDSNGNDMIFNGAGFIGHHVFVLPNVSSLTGDGFNTNQSLKSDLQVNSALRIIEMFSTTPEVGTSNTISFHPYSTQLSQYKLADTLYDNLDGFTSTTRAYIKSENIYCRVNSGAIESTKLCWLVKYLYNGTTVTQFDIRQPYEGARDLLTDSLQVDVTTLTGYDSTQTQTLKNINGVLTWVTD